MVCGQHHDGVVGLPGFLKRVQYAADVMVEVRNQPALALRSARPSDRLTPRVRVRMLQKRAKEWYHELFYMRRPRSSPQCGRTRAAARKPRTIKRVLFENF